MAFTALRHGKRAKSSAILHVCRLTRAVACRIVIDKAVRRQREHSPAPILGESSDRTGGSRSRRDRSGFLDSIPTAPPEPQPHGQKQSRIAYQDRESQTAMAFSDQKFSWPICEKLGSGVEVWN